MGQQQLILLVLATVIVGIAIVVGISAFTENSAKANADAMVQDAVRIASDMQAFKKKPAAFGGQASTAATAANIAAEADFTGATWELLGYELDADGNYTNLNGTFTLTAGATPTIVGVNAIEGNTVGVRLCGMDDEDVRGEILELSADAPTAGLAPAACPAG